MDAHVLQQIDLFPAEIPEYAIRYWQAAERWYKSTNRTPTRDEFVKKFDPPIPGTRTFDRWKHDHPDLMPWPPKRGQRPPWEPRANGLSVAKPDEIRPLRRVRVAGFDDNGQVVTTIQFFDPETGELVTSRLATDGEKPPQTQQHWG